MARKYRSETEGAALVARYRESGLTIRSFASAEGIKVSALLYWLHKARRGSKPATACSEAHFIEVTPRATGMHPIDNNGLVVETGSGLRLRFEKLPRPQYLAEVIAALEVNNRC